jgi:hypothetical protein
MRGRITSANPLLPWASLSLSGTIVTCGVRSLPAEVQSTSGNVAITLFAQRLFKKTA